MDAHELNIEELFEKIDWTELHKLRTLTYGYNQPIIIWADDGSLTLLSSNEWPNTDRYFFSLSTTGWGNIETSQYAEGWASEEKDEYGNFTRNYIDDETGRVMTEEEMVSECINEGDWAETYEYWKDELRGQHEEKKMNEIDVEAYRDAIKRVGLD